MHEDFYGFQGNVLPDLNLTEQNKKLKRYSGYLLSSFQTFTMAQ